VNSSLPAYPKLARDISARLAVLRDNLPSTLQGFRTLSESALGEGALSARTKELMALALGIAAHCDGCIAFHVKALASMGATLSEIEETVAVALYMGGGPSLMYGANALVAYDQFTARTAAETA